MSFNFVLKEKYCSIIQIMRKYLWVNIYKKAVYYVTIVIIGSLIAASMKTVSMSAGDDKKRWYFARVSSNFFVKKNKQKQQSIFFCKNNTQRTAYLNEKIIISQYIIFYRKSNFQTVKRCLYRKTTVPNKNIFLNKRNIFLHKGKNIASNNKKTFTENNLIASQTKTYFTILQKSNILNQLFVKWGWAWTLSLLSPFVYMTSVVYSSNNVRNIRQQLARLLVATLLWYCSTSFFVNVERQTGKCSIGGMTGQVW